MGSNKILIFDSHPVQYKAPVYRAIEQLLPGSFEVVYATDASVRKGHVDKQFGKEVAWDTPLLEGYPWRVLGNENGVPMSNSASLTGRGVFALLRRERPRAVLLTQAFYRFDHVAYLSALVLRIPILIRQETQDEMYDGQRSPIKELARQLIYRMMYLPVRHAFAFGHLNWQHLTRHGISPARISRAHFSVLNAVSDLSEAQKREAAAAIRQQYEVAPDKLLISFFGKLIHKKNPDLIYEALGHLPEAVRARAHIMLVGSGELEGMLREAAQTALARYGIGTTFCGFINQKALPAYYLASDIVVLPSRRMGEAWGLVMNEALDCGCGVIMSRAAGCHPEFGHWERARVIQEGDAQALATAVQTLATYERDFNWAAPQMQAYSTEAAARAMADEFKKYVY